MFGSKVYSYNFEGRTSVHSVMGVICSVWVRLFALYFFYDKGMTSYKGANPIVTNYEELDVHTGEAGAVDLSFENFEVSFAVRDYLEGVFKDDESIV